jgi:hypothetical protein
MYVSFEVLTAVGDCGDFCLLDDPEDFIYSLMRNEKEEVRLLLSLEITIFPLGHVVITDC